MERVLGSLWEHRDHACFSYLKTGSSAKGGKHLERGVSEGDPRSVLFGPQRVSKKMLAVSEALYGRTGWKGHGPLGQPKGVIAVLGDRPAGLTLPGPSEPHTHPQSQGHQQQMGPDWT